MNASFSLKDYPRTAEYVAANEETLEPLMLLLSDYLAFTADYYTERAERGDLYDENVQNVMAGRNFEDYTGSEIIDLVLLSMAKKYAKDLGSSVIILSQKLR